MIKWFGKKRDKTTPIPTQALPEGHPEGNGHLPGTPPTPPTWSGPTWPTPELLAAAPLPAVSFETIDDAEPSTPDQAEPETVEMEIVDEAPEEDAPTAPAQATPNGDDPGAAPDGATPEGETRSTPPEPMAEAPEAFWGGAELLRIPPSPPLAQSTDEDHALSHLQGAPQQVNQA
ncbi:MAG: hypothetical protein R3185_03765, partial [Candidatus Thermoplasmatota archaeon]|nr:hypothetical protein [Candidatus Thermoplasmatota archaeon]